VESWPVLLKGPTGKIRKYNILDHFAGGGPNQEGE
jgi:hypothetical protein